MDASITIAIVAGSITAIGWLVNHLLSHHRDIQRQRTEASLKYVERQLEELYGPLAFLIYEGRRTFKDLLESLGRKRVFPPDRPLSDDELRNWLFWAETDFLPRNEKIKKLLMSKTHLIEGAKFPDSCVTFLNHCNSWVINHRRWKEEKIEYSWHSKIDWPKEFDEEIIETFEKLKSRHAALLGKLS